MSVKQKTVGEIILETDALRRRKAVYEDLIQFLNQFISSDSHTPVKGIKSPIGNEEVVSEDFIESVVLEQRMVIHTIENEIARLMSQSARPVKVFEEPAKNKVRLKAPTKRRKYDKKTKK